jgi:Zn-dependent M16 (insulinase) family peptidase
VAFRTIPTDSTGVAHILEHTALCGSRRFPVRDPFFMMTRRSLNTFMNAFTGSDWTAYPFASQNRKDFDNLLQVYLDAVFFPTLNELDFAQEGHRLEFEDPQNPESDLIYKGVVYNEMKGAMSSPIARLWQSLSAELFPTTTYHFNSGGEPEEIPNLSYAGLKAFHARHYHPSNAFFATYGDFPVEGHQARFHEWALRYFESRPADLGVPDERRYDAPRRITVHYALDDQEGTRDKTHIVLGWLLGNTTDLRQVMDAHLMTGVLLNHSASPLRHALETTALGKAPSELCGLESAHREATFVCGLEGSNVEHADAVERLILDVVEGVARNGVPTDMAESVLHQMEIAQREIRSGAHPYGLQLLESAIPAALHQGDPIAVLAIDPVLAQLRIAIQDPQYIQDLASRWLLQNPHRVRVVMGPDTGLSARLAATTRERLAELKSHLDARQRSSIVKQAAELLERQAHKDDPDVLPKVSLEDVPPDLKIPKGETSPVQQVPTTWFREGTNGLVYESVVVAVPPLSQAQTDLLRLYTSCVTELGCGERDYLATQAWQASVSGGVSAHCAVRAAINELEAPLAYFRLDTRGLARNQSALAELLHTGFWKARFDESARLRELIAQICAGREAAVTDHGHMLAAAAAAASLGSVAALNHHWDGLLGLQRLKALNKSLEDDASLREFAEGLASIHATLVRAPRELLVVSESKYQDEIAAVLANVWREGNEITDRASFRPEVKMTGANEAWLTSTEVNFCARAYPVVAADHPDAAALIVLGRFLHNGFLHRAIREQGGAYGSGASYDGDTGTFRFYSYRDPRLAETLADFDRALLWLHEEQHEYRQLEEAILGVVSAIDRPGSPAGEAIKAFVSKLYGRTPDYMRRLRQRVLAVQIEDLKRVAADYLRPGQARTAAVTSQAQLQRYPELELVPIQL